MSASHALAGEIGPQNSDRTNTHATSWTRPTLTRTEQTSTGWYPDPTGRHESRFFDGLWTQHVSTRGVSFVDPLAAVSAPAGTASFVAPAYLPSGPARQVEPSAPSAGPRAPKAKLAAAAALVAVAGGLALAVSMSGAGSAGHGFCADAHALNQRYPSARVVAADIERDPSEISYMIDRLDALAAESPSPRDAADLRYLARFVRDFATGDYVSAETEMPQAEATGNRIDAYVTNTCSRP